MTLRRAIKRLRLKEGDIILCRDPDVMDAISRLRIPGLRAHVPILFTPEKNTITTMKREELLKLIGESSST